ncbi:PQQ-binding-like beta-propeller repeat protein [bacterium]|nr:PQQ-binding-like beta-propeller repeat protein [bacterium]
MIKLTFLKRGFYLLILTLLITGCETAKGPITGERVSVFEKNIDEKNTAIDEKILLNRPYINESWTSSSGNASNTLGHIGGKKKLIRFAKNDIGVKTSSAQILYTPVANKDTVFTIDGKLKITATSLATGKTLWSNPRLTNNEYLRYGALALDNERLYAITNTSQLVAINPENGEIIYSKYFNTPLKSGLQICDDKLYFSNDIGEFFVIDAKTGDKIFIHKTMEEANSFVKGSVPMCVNNNLVVAFPNGEVHMLMRDNNTVIWLEALHKINTKSLNNMSDILANPVTDGKIVIVKGYNDNMKAFNIENGTMMWELPVGGITTPTLSNKFMFDINNDNILNAIDITNGKIIWSKKIDIKDKKAIPFDPLLVNNQIILTFSNGELIRVNPYTGKIINKEKLTSVIDTTPIIIEDKFIILSNADVIIYK